MATRGQVDQDLQLCPKTAEICVATVNRGAGAIAYDWRNSHSSLACVVQTGRGLMR
jgi:hypothetical protein